MNESRRVYVCAYDPLPPNCVGGFDWYYKLADARAAYDKSRTESGYVWRLFAFPVSEGMDRDDITDAIDESESLYGNEESSL